MINNVLIIIGMHRSGTSLCASWLHKCGLNIGENLAGNAIGNVKGQYEDIDFLKLHEQILKSNNLTYKISNQQIKTENWINSMQELVSNKNSKPQWGWKEPRTCLFLKEYHQILPKSKNLIIYRDYNEVVDSLVRRFIKQETKSKRKNKLAKFFNIYVKYKYFKKYTGNEWLKVWIRYNKEILNYISLKNKSDYFITDLNDLIKNDAKTYSILTEQYKFQLNHIPFSEVYDDSLISTTKFPYHFSSKLLDEVNQINAKFQKIKLTQC